MEDNFLFIIFYNIHQIIYVTEVRYQRKQISILLCNAVKFSKVDTQAKNAIFFLYKEYRCSRREKDEMYESGVQVFADKVLEYFLFYSRE